MTSTYQYWSLGESAITLSHDNDLWSMGDLYNLDMITRGRLVIRATEGTTILRRSINPNKPISIFP
jgi:hypothetical protein